MNFVLQLVRTVTEVYYKKPFHCLHSLLESFIVRSLVDLWKLVIKRSLIRLKIYSEPRKSIYVRFSYQILHEEH